MWNMSSPRSKKKSKDLRNTSPLPREFLWKEGDEPQRKQGCTEFWGSQVLTNSKEAGEWKTMMYKEEQKRKLALLVRFLFSERKPVPLEKQQGTVHETRRPSQAAESLSWSRQMESVREEEEEQLLRPGSYTAETKLPLPPRAGFQTCVPAHTLESEGLKGKDWVFWGPAQSTLIQGTQNSEAEPPMWVAAGKRGLPLKDSGNHLVNGTW